MMMMSERRAMMMIPPGYHFVPSDEELISLYLLKASMGLPMPSIREISERDLYGDKVDPWDVLSDVYWDMDHDHMESKSKHRVTYVVTTLSRADGKTRAARRTRTGTWKGQTSGTAIHDESGELIGMRKMFSFMTADNKKSDDRWIMHEYTLAGISLKYDGLKNKDLVLCRIKHVFKDNNNNKQQNHYHYPILQESGNNNNNNNKRRLVDEEEDQEEEQGLHHVEKKMQKQQTSTLISSEDDDDDNMIDWNRIDLDTMDWSTLANLTTCSSDDLDCLGLDVVAPPPPEQQPQQQYQFPKRLGIC